MTKFYCAIKIFLNKVWQSIINFFRWLNNFLSPVENSIRGFINEEEVYRVFCTALTTVGSLNGLFHYLYNHIGAWMSNPTLVVFVQTFIKSMHKHWFFTGLFIALLCVDYFRRKYLHGK